MCAIAATRANVRPAQTRGPTTTNAGAVGNAKRRGRLFERIAPYKRSEALKRWQSDFLRGRHDSLVRRLRAEMRRWLPELGECGEDVRAAVELALSFEAWDRLRSDQKLWPGRTLAAMERMAAALLGSPLAERPRQGGRAARVRRPGRR
jgi:hypothetical protein